MSYNFYKYRLIMKVTKKIHVSDMYCISCESDIEESLIELDGVLFVKANYSKSMVNVCFDTDRTNLIAIQALCASKGYTLILQPESKKHNIVKIFISFLALTCLVLILILSRQNVIKFNLPEINSQMGYGMIFIVGLFTGLHCVGMCGSFIIGYTARDAGNGRSLFRSHLLYGTGKIVSYGLFGAIFGFVGSIFQITPFISGLSISLAGAFLIIYGLNMLNIFSVFKSIRLKLPISLSKYVNKKSRKSRSPLYIGFFSGFILGCGPLQVMYVMAAGNGDPLEGAFFLMLFGLGTLPALLAFGFLARILSNVMTRRFLYASGVILLVLGSIMFNKGISKTFNSDNSKTNQPESCCHQT